jgi:hypothetical protein
MSDMYVIQWKSKVNGRAGRGSKLFERDEAKRLVEELNSEYPDIDHELTSAPQHPPEGMPGAEDQVEGKPEIVHITVE